MNWTFLIWIAAISAVPLVIKFVVIFIWAPIRVHGSQTVAVLPSMQPVDASTLTPEMREFMDFVIQRLRGAGFEELDLCGNNGALPGVKSAVATLVNRGTQDIAVVIVTQSGSHRGLVYAIRTDFADESRISTGVNPGIGMWPRDPADHNQTFSFIEDPLQLYEAHLRLIDQDGLAALPRRRAPLADEAADYQAWDWQRNFRCVLKKRYYRLDADAHLYRATWKGAFLMTWRLVSPIKQWRISLRNRRARKLWAKLQMGPVRPFAIAPPTATLAAIPVNEFDGAQSTIPKLPAMLTYETSLAEGEVRTEFAGGQATVRAGNATRLRVLSRQKWRLASLLFFGGASGMSFYRWWTWRSIIRSFPPAVASGLNFELPFTFWMFVGLFLLDLIRIINVLRHTRATTVVVGSPAGLRFTNAPAGTADGACLRSRVESLLIVPRVRGFRKKEFNLIVSFYGTTGRIILLSGSDREAISEARDGLAQAMGIEMAPESALVAEVVV